MKIDKEDAKKKFDNFLMVMDDQLDALQDQALLRNIKLDLSLDDLDRLEILFNLMSENTDKETVSSLIVIFARHLGELVRTNYGGQWQLPLDNEKNVNFNTPVIIGHSLIEGLEFAPIPVIRAFALRRKPGTFKRAVDAQIHINPIDLSDLSEE